MEVISNIINRCAEAWQVSYSQADVLLSINHQKSLRINSLKQNKKISVDIIKSFKLTPISWCENSYTIGQNYSDASRSILFSQGYFILQDQASFVPVLALEPRPNENILDLCAAPGAKTSHIAALSKNRANIVANDSSKSRLFKLRALVKTYDVKAELTLYDGRNLFKKYSSESFDKILLDAPCSGEAAINPNTPKTYANWTYAKSKRLSRLQEQLIVHAYDLLKPGGTLVYNTCTIAPEENEMVVNKLLKRRDAYIEPIESNIDNVQSGLTKWQEKSFDQTVSRTLRILPSNNHQAFYCAKISKPSLSNDNEFTYNPTR